MNLLVPQNLIKEFLKSKYKDEEFSVAIKPDEPVDIDWKKLFKNRTKIRFVAVKDTPGSDKFWKNVDKAYNIYDIFDGKDIIPATQNEYDVEIAKIFVEEKSEALSQDMLPKTEKDIVVVNDASEETEANVNEMDEEDERFQVSATADNSARLTSNVEEIAKITKAFDAGKEGYIVGDSGSEFDTIQDISSILMPDTPIIGEDYNDVVNEIEKKSAEVAKKAKKEAKKEADKQAKLEKKEAEAKNPKYQLYVVSLESALNKSTASQREKIASELLAIKDKGEVEGILKKYLKRTVTKRELEMIMSFV